jgi:hypothetical protein
MGKHETGYARVERDGYQTRQGFVVRALAEHVAIEGLDIWEFAAGEQLMARDLKACGARRVFTSDIEPYPGLDAVFDFLSPGLPAGLTQFDGMVTNPPWGVGNRTAVAFIEAGLDRIATYGGFLAMLLPADFGAGVTRSHLFQHPFYLLRITLLDRPVWFERADGKPAQPKENCVWQVWARPVLRFPVSAIVRHAVTRSQRRAA